jgi:IclR family transcriptional regulator, KDG regulon repressor
MERNGCGCQKRGSARVKQDYRIAAVDKALDILEFLGQQRQEHSLPELSEALRLPKVTTFRYLATLEPRGYVRRNPENDKYSLGLRVLQLSNEAVGNLTVHEVALPYMKRILDRFQETVNMAVMEGNEVVYVEILESPQPFKMSSHVGGREVPHATSLGKAMLAFLPQEEVSHIIETTGLPVRTARTICTLSRLQEELVGIRQRGYAVDDSENEEGARCVGVPILGHRGRAIAAISVSGPASRLSADEIERLGLALVEVSSEISHRLGYTTGR